MMQKMKVAAVQMRAKLANVKSNLSAAEALVREAFRRGAKWVILPEFFPSAVAFAPNMLTAWRPLEGEPFQLMQKLAREYEGVVGGSFIAKSGYDCLNSFLLVFPSGEYFRHDKDIPTMWENCYYIGGQDDGVLPTPAGPVGVALCWEFIRSRTARRLQNRVDLVVGGSCWWDLPLPVDAKYEADRTQVYSFLKNAPSRLARMVGAPVIHASHAGDFVGLNPGDESRKYRSRYLGETQIVDGTGKVLARMGYDDGEGMAFADLELSRVPPTEPIPEAVWIEPLPATASKAWERLNSFGRNYYSTVVKPTLAQGHLAHPER
jgi:N-carbamoylputrescine amidase